MDCYRVWRQDRQLCLYRLQASMGMMTLGLAAGDAITVEAEGEDEEKAVSEIEKLLGAQ